MLLSRSCRTTSRRFLTTSSKFHDITTYLKYAKSNHISVQSTVFQGTIFEVYTKKMLTSIFNVSNIRMVGGAGDGGIDITCDWDLLQYVKSKDDSNDEIRLNSGSKAQLKEIYEIHSIKPLVLLMQTDKKLKSSKKDKGLDPVKMIVQCKSSKKKLGARLIRELIGAHTMSVRDGNPLTTFFMIASTNMLSEAALEVFNQAQIPIIYVQLLMPSIFDSLRNVDLVFQLTTKYYKPANYEKGGIILLYLRNNFCSLLLKGLDDYKVINEKIIDQTQLYTK